MQHREVLEFIMGHKSAIRSIRALLTTPNRTHFPWSFAHTTEHDELTAHMRNRIQGELSIIDLQDLKLVSFYPKIEDYIYREVLKGLAM